MKILRIGIIGVGGIANNHMGGILKSKNMVIAAIADVNQTNLDNSGDAYGVKTENRYLDYKKLLKREDIDAVTIATPNFTHYEIAKQAIFYGKPFMLEKPVVLHKHEAKELKELAEKNSVKSMIAFSYRFKAAVRYAKHLIETGYLGEINHVYGSYLQSFGNEDVPLLWRFSKKLAGSGALGDLGSHILDLTRFLVGDITEVVCDAETMVPQRKKMNSDEYGQVDVDDYCHYLTKIGPRIRGVFEISRMAYGRGNYQRIEIYGTKGGLVYELEDQDTLSICIGPVYGKGLNYQRITVPQEFHADQMQGFYNIVMGQDDGWTATLEDGYMNQQYIDALIHSSEQKGWVSL
ncbi:Gfo/Idh/MocA family protein [Lederbergia ruris]|uniref:Gfo/Idh/MocA family protein n=1 Tax=Lederbergia ruris TaxID=217495 RepID=UPI0039A30D86